MLSLVVVAVMLVFGWAAERQVQLSLIQAGGDRAQAVAGQLVDLLDRSVRQSRDELRQLAARPELHRFLEDPKDIQAAEAVRALLTAPPAPGLHRVELWDDAGTRLLEVIRTSSDGRTGTALPEPQRPTGTGMLPLQAVNDLVFTELVEEVRDGATAQEARLGFVVVSSTLAVNPPGILSRLVGPDATVLFGNKSGDVWTDLTHVVPRPLVDLSRPGPAEYTAIVEVAFDCIITIDAQGIVNEYNPAAERTFGYRRDEAVSRELAALIIPPGDRDAHRLGLAPYLKTGAGPVLGKLIEVQALRADGSEFPAELAITEILSVPPMFTGVVRDITSRRAAEAALVESERAFRSTFDDAPLGIAQVGVDGKWIRVNRHLAAVLARDPDELCGQTFLEIFHPDDPAPDLNMLADQPGDREARVRRKDGHYILVRLTISALRNVSGAPRHFIVILEDVSDRRRLEERLRQSQKMEAIGRLAGGVAHDFNNLLTAILGYAQLLADDIPSTDPRRRDVDEIIKAAERSAALTGQLLAFSRKQVLKPTTLDLNALISDTSVMLRRLIGEHIDLVTTLAPNLKPVHADITQLEQIVINLSLNARDAMPSGGRLTFETANVELDETSGPYPVVVEPGSYVMLAVNDTGMGMDAETRRHLFEPFFTTKEQGRGTGLGLATVYGIVKQSGGYIWVYSEPGQGASFKVYFPVAAEAMNTPRRRMLPSNRQGTETILLVEDERAVRVMTRSILERCGYHVIEAATPDEVIQLFRKHADAIDLLLTDVVMPGCHGPALFKQLSAERASLNVLYMSGYTDDEVIKAGRLEPGADFLDKPFTAQKLSEKIRDILDR